MKRTYLIIPEYDALLHRHDGMCCVVGCSERNGLMAEHSTTNAIYPGKPDQQMCKPCHKVKMLRDVKAIAKMKLLNGTKMSQYERRKKYGPMLRGRGFEQRG